MCVSETEVIKTVHIISTNIRVNLMEYRNLFLHESLRWYLGLLEAASTQHLHGIMVRAKNTSTVLTEIFYFSSKDVYGPLSSLWLEVPEDSHFEVFSQSGGMAFQPGRANKGKELRKLSLHQRVILV